MQSEVTRRLGVIVALAFALTFGLSCTDSEVDEPDVDWQFDEPMLDFLDIEVECSPGSDPARCDLARECMAWARLDDSGPNEIYFVNRCGQSLYFAFAVEDRRELDATFLLDIQVDGRSIIALMPSGFYTSHECPRGGPCVIVSEVVPGARFHFVGPRLCGDRIQHCENGELVAETIGDEDELQISIFLGLPSPTDEELAYFEGCPPFCGEGPPCGSVPDVLIGRRVLNYTRHKMHTEGDPCPHPP